MILQLKTLSSGNGGGDRGMRLPTGSVVGGRKGISNCRAFLAIEISL